MHLASLIFVSLLLMTRMALAETADQSGCPNVQIVSDALEKHFPEIKLTHYKGVNARRFVDAYNTDLASSYWPADEVLIARNPLSPNTARIGFFKQGCLLALVARSLWFVDSLQRSLPSEQET
jgi:hypothetical protein